jgi:hypothetical protein
VTEHYNFLIGNCVKYLWRQGIKDEAGLDPLDKQIEDCRKARWYLDRHISNLEKQREEAEIPTLRDLTQ